MNLDEREQQWLLEEKYSGVKTDDYYTDLQRLTDGEPVDYLIGHREFLGCHIDLSHRPLIPRNETEFWVNHVINEHRQLPGHRISRNVRILDLCAGSGCIGVACLRHITDCHVDFAEINPEFIKQIQKNITLNLPEVGPPGVYPSDLFVSVPRDSQNKYDLILSNPPYIAPERKNTVQDSVHEHEDHKSLYSDNDGLDHIKRIIDVLPEYLSPTGFCCIEFDPWQVSLLDEYLSLQSHFTWEYLKDQFDKDRVIKLSLLN